MSGRTSSQVKKHKRSRSGCLTCRHRRIKCDEVKPKCTRCRIGSRECTYPPPSRLPPLPESDKLIRTSPQPVNSGSESSSPDFHLSDEGDDCMTRPRAIVRFGSSSSTDSPEHDPTDQFSTLHMDTQMLIDSLAPPTFVTEPLNFIPPPLAFTSITGLSPASFSQGLQSRASSTALSPPVFSIPRALSPPADHTQPIRFFLNFHRETITEAHYFRYYDYNKLHTKVLFAMAEELDCMRHSLVAFSALIYSIKIHSDARVIAFIYYAMALQELRALLNKSPMEMAMWEWQGAVATALQLSTFDRFFGDIGKCFRHLEGAAGIMQKVTDPVQLCSTTIGRSLLEWFSLIEDYCCFLAAYRCLLPITWREENVRKRAEIALRDYPLLAREERKPRILDDVWQQYLAIVPRLADILVGVVSLKEMQKEERAMKAARLEADLRAFDKDIRALLKRPHVLEVLQIAPLPISFRNKHASCCPPLPFVPHILQYPPAGFFRQIFLAVQAYTRAVLLPPLRSANPLEATEMEGEDLSYFSLEMCRTFAGLEYSLGDYPDALLPCFSSLVLATATCPLNARQWLWYKLSHLERLGHLTFDPIKRNLASLWDMPDLAVSGYRSLRGSPNLKMLRTLSCEDITACMDQMKLVDQINIEDDPVLVGGIEEDPELTHLMEGRGLYGIKEMQHGL